MIDKSDIIQKMTEIELQPSIVDQANSHDDYQKVPLSKISAAGTAFDSIAAAFEHIINGNQASSGLYRVTIPNGGALMEFKDGSGYLGAVKAANGGVGGGQARLNPLVCNPATLCMAMTLISIDKKLDKIQDLQKEMFEYIKVKDKAELRGNLNFLTDILSNYKYNWDNDNFKQAHLVKTQDIKQSAEKNIEQYRSLIQTKVHKRGFLQTDHQVKIQLNEVTDLFHDYSLSIYIHAFASFLEVMLLKNFDSGYLQHVTSRIENNSNKYNELYNEIYSRIEQSLDKSVQGHLLGGLAAFNKGAGHVVERIPIVEKTLLDEGLNKAGDMLHNKKARSISKRMNSLDSTEESPVRTFIDSINMIDAIYNESFELLFDEEYLYLKV